MLTTRRIPNSVSDREKQDLGPSTASSHYPRKVEGVSRPMTANSDTVAACKRIRCPSTVSVIFRGNGNPSCQDDAVCHQDKYFISKSICKYLLIIFTNIIVIIILLIAK